MKCSFLNPNYGCQVHLDTIINKNLGAALSSPQQCPIVHGEVRGQGRPGLIRVSVMCQEDGLCDDICSFLQRCKDDCTHFRKDAKVKRLRRHKQKIKNWQEKQTPTFSHTAPGARPAVWRGRGRIPGAVNSPWVYSFLLFLWHQTSSLLLTPSSFTAEA